MFTPSLFFLVNFQEYFRIFKIFCGISFHSYWNIKQSPFSGVVWAAFDMKVDFPYHWGSRRALDLLVGLKHELKHSPLSQLTHHYRLFLHILDSSLTPMWRVVYVVFWSFHYFQTFSRGWWSGFSSTLASSIRCPNLWRIQREGLWSCPWPSPRIVKGWRWKGLYSLLHIVGKELGLPAPENVHASFSPAKEWLLLLHSAGQLDINLGRTDSYLDHVTFQHHASCAENSALQSCMFDLQHK